jgi:predicted nucleic acid-binding protein
MPKTERIVINTSPLIALVAASGDLNILHFLYREVLVPFEVCQEICTGGLSNFAVAQFEEAIWLQKQQQPLNINTLLLNSLDRGEAAVIQLAKEQNIQTVCIDEAVGRRYARLSGLSVTGSIGILLRAKKEGYPVNISRSIEQMLDKGIRLSATVINFALVQSGEIDRGTL